MENIDISNYIYLIFILLSLVFGALGKKKKKQQKAGKPKREQPSFLDQLVNEMSLEEKEAEVQEVHNTVAKEAKPNDHSDVRKKAELLRRRSAVRQDIDTSFDQELTRDDELNFFEQKEKTAHSRVNLRQAVIHDAILNRPKY